jgi:hypothetical protein
MSKTRLNGPAGDGRSVARRHPLLRRGIDSNRAIDDCKEVQCDVSIIVKELFVQKWVILSTRKVMTLPAQSRSPKRETVMVIET